MPKRAHKIDQFHGGINIGADPRDIKMNECVDMVDISLSSMGRLVQLGSFLEHESTSTGSIQHEVRGTDTAGYGLFHFSSDYKMLDTNPGDFLDGTSPIAGPSNFLLLYNNAHDNHIAIFQKDNNPSGAVLDWSAIDGDSEIDLGGGSAVATPVFYHANGAVRIGDASRTPNNKTKWLGVITPKVYGNHTPQDTAGNGGAQTYQEYGAFYTRNEASVYRTSTQGGTSGVGATNAKWVIENQEIKGAFEETVNDDGDTICLNAIMCNTESQYIASPAFGNYPTSDPPATGAHTAGFGFANEKTDTGTSHLSTTTAYASDMYWGLGCQFREGQNGTWMPSSTTRYKFYVTTMYDDNTQESLPQLMAMYGAKQLVPTYTATTLSFDADAGGSKSSILDSADGFIQRGFSVGQVISVTGFTGTDDDNNVSAKTLTDVAIGEIKFAIDADTSDEAAGDTVTVSVDSTCDYTAIATANDNLQFITKSAGSEIYMADSGADNQCNKFGTPGTNLRAWFNPIVKINGAVHSSTDEVPANSNKFVFGNGNDASAVNYGNPRISGFKIYWASNEDGYSTLWEIMEGDFVKGLKALGLDGAGGESGYAPWQHYSMFPFSEYTGVNNDVDNSTAGLYMKADWPISNRWIHPPRYRTYFENNFHEHTATVKVDYFKTAVVVGTRAYIGNVTQTIDGEQEHFPDRILKSPPRQYDKFPSENKMDAGINDGDEIIHLATYADRILQFNKNVMYIINVSQDQEYIEDVQRFKGIHHSASVCTTDEGIAWANDNGCYFYNGNNVINLLEANNIQLIDSKTWSDFVTNSASLVKPMVGYMRDKRELIVADDVSTHGAGAAYRFSFITKSWTRTSNAHVVDQDKSNFITDYNGDLIYYDYQGDEMKIWNSTASSSTASSYITKDEDFGEPAVRKKIYKVYITHKGSASNMQLSYAIDGTNSFTEVGSELPASSPTTAWVTTEIKVSIPNCYSLQLKLLADGTVPANFEINDITIIYRPKAIK